MSYAYIVYKGKPGDTLQIGDIRCDVTTELSNAGRIGVEIVHPVTLIGQEPIAILQNEDFEKSRSKGVLRALIEKKLVKFVTERKAIAMLKELGRTDADLNMTPIEDIEIEDIDTPKSNTSKETSSIESGTSDLDALNKKITNLTNIVGQLADIVADTKKSKANINKKRKAYNKKRYQELKQKKQSGE